jgi:hypothetical protein
MLSSCSIVSSGVSSYAPAVSAATSRGATAPAAAAALPPAEAARCWPACRTAARAAPASGEASGGRGGRPVATLRSAECSPRPQVDQANLRVAAPTASTPAATAQVLGMGDSEGRGCGGGGAATATCAASSRRGGAQGFIQGWYGLQKVDAKQTFARGGTAEARCRCCQRRPPDAPRRGSCRAAAAPCPLHGCILGQPGAPEGCPVPPCPPVPSLDCRQQRFRAVLLSAASMQCLQPYWS